jgi:DNA-binding CsgD family transcriptional regulator
MQSSAGLSRREEEVIGLLLQGKSNKQIALLLGISERTVEFHLNHIYTKVQVRSRVELILKLGKTAGGFPGKPVEASVESGDENEYHGKQADRLKDEAQPPAKTILLFGKEFAMSFDLSTFIRALNVLMGVVLMIGGIVSDKIGATIIGLLVSAVTIAQWVASQKRSNPAGK